MQKRWRQGSHACGSGGSEGAFSVVRQSKLGRKPRVADPWRRMFRSFFHAGFECSSARNQAGERLHQVAATQHDKYLLQDYLRLRELGILVVREGISWPHVETEPNRYELSVVQHVLEASEQAGIQIIFDLFHFGYPDACSPFAPDFASRFADYCQAVARKIAVYTTSPPFFTVVNEPSYFAWAGGEVGLFAPHETGRGPELKRQLLFAAIRGIDAIRAVCPTARFVNVDPLCWTVPSKPANMRAANEFNRKLVYQGWDALCGRIFPELGGSPDHLDVIGINYYAINQWQLDAPFLDRKQLVRRPLRQDDARRRPLRDLLADVWRRYGREMVITETAHLGRSRAPWLRQVAVEVDAAIRAGVPVRGICLYPALAMPRWNDTRKWLQMGLWDLHESNGALVRTASRSYHDALAQVQYRFSSEGRLQGPALTAHRPRSVFE